MSTTQPSIPDRDNDCFIKFDSRSDYNHFVGNLRFQLRSYLIASCEENNIEIGSPDFRTIESILMDVFMKYTLEFIRENLLVEGRPLSPPPEFSAASDSSRRVNGVDNPSSRTNSRNKDAQQLQTKPCDTALNERVIRQQYALYDAAVGNTRKRMAFAGHIVERFENAAEQSAEQLKTHIEEVDKLEAERTEQLSTEPQQRWNVLNAELENSKRTQGDFTSSNQLMCQLMKSLPELIETATRAIDLHEEVTNTLKTV